MKLQAIVVEAQDTQWQAAEVSPVGRQGLLPKLDVVLLVNHFLRTQLGLSAGLPSRKPALLEQVKSLLPPPATSEQKKYVDLLEGTLGFVTLQVGGMPDGAHAAFKDYAVDAVTARLISVCNHVNHTSSAVLPALRIPLHPVHRPQVLH